MHSDTWRAQLKERNRVPVCAHPRPLLRPPLAAKSL